MKLDEARGLIDGSSIAEESLTTLSASRFTETAEASILRDAKSSIDSRKFSMDTEENCPQNQPEVSDFAKPGQDSKVV